MAILYLNEEKMLHRIINLNIPDDLKTIAIQGIFDRDILIELTKHENIQICETAKKLL